MNSSSDKNAQGASGLGADETAVVVVRKENVQPVLDFLASFERDVDDVAGHMLAILDRRTVSNTSGTNCAQVGTAGLGTDLKCADSDQTGIT